MENSGKRVPYRAEDGEVYYDDENGRRWKSVALNDCPQVSDPNYKPGHAIRKLKLTFTVHVETELISVPYPHYHQVFEPAESDLKSVSPVRLNWGERECKMRHYFPLMKGDVELAEKQLLEFAGSDNEEADPALQIAAAAFQELTEHIDKHFEYEVNRLIDRFSFEGSLTSDRGQERERSIRYSLDEDEHAMRERLVVPKGRTPLKVRSEFETDKQEFIQKCLNAMATIDAQRERLTRTRLAKHLFERHSNPLQSLRRKLQIFGLAFQEMVETYEEMKS